MRGNITKRGSHSWRIKFDRGRDPQTGQRLITYKTVRGRKAEAERELAQMVHHLDTGEHVEPQNMTVAEFLPSWLKQHASRISAKTHERYEEIITKHLVPALGKLRLQRLTASHIEDYYATALLAGRRDGGGGLSARTVLHHHRVLHSALKGAVRLRLVPRCVTSDVSAPRPRRAEIKTLSDSEMAAIIRAAEVARWGVPTIVAATTGLRRGEVLGLRWSDVDLPNRRLHVSQVVSELKGSLQFKEPKTARGRRSVTLPGLTVDALKKHRAAQAEQWLAMGLGRDANALVFTDEKGTVLRPSSMTHAVKLLMNRIGKPGASLKTLRHSHATQLLKIGTHPKVMSERMGHSSVSITLDIYSHVQPSMQEEAANAVDVVMRTALERKDDKA